MWRVASQRGPSVEQIKQQVIQVISSGTARRASSLTALTLASVRYVDRQEAIVVPRMSRFASSVS